MKLRVVEWRDLDPTAQSALLARPSREARAGIVERAAEIVAEVRRDGDRALARYARELDAVELDAFAVSAEEFESARRALPPLAVRALERAIANVRAFHEAQTPAPIDLETSPGVRCERITRPISAVGLYVPAGSAPLPSAVVMLAVPAAVAGCPLRVLCTPPQRNGAAHPAILVAAELCGISRVFKLGGAQAIAAMSYGTATVPKVDKVFGPGNAWVTAAKQLVAADASGAAFDLPAGPSEVLVIADETARPEFVAADLLAQAEHDPLSQAILITDSPRLAAAVATALAEQAALLSRRAILEQSIAASRAIVVDSLDLAMQISNRYAPEHLILQVRSPRAWLPSIVSAGSIFLGPWSPEPLGDYCSGTNHVLPTYGYARAYSGLSVIDFLKRITVQELSTAGLQDLGPVAATLADLEGLDAHAAAVRRRLQVLATAGNA